MAKVKTREKKDSSTWDPSEQESSINRLVGSESLETKQKKKQKKKRRFSGFLGIPSKNKKRESSKSTSAMNMTDAEINKLKFETDIPERIIRQSLAVFDQFDLDQSGFIQQSELKDTLNAMGINANEQQLHRLMAKFDENGDDQISVAEFMKLVKTAGLYNDEVVKNDEEKENITCAFVALGGNSDHSGKVSCLKLKQMVDAFDLDLDVKALLKLLDEDENGTVNYQEFAALFTTQKRRRSVVNEIVHVMDEPDKM